MAQIVIFNTQTNKFIDTIPGQFPVNYQGRADVLIYETDTSMLAVRELIRTVPSRYLIVDNGLLREMTQGEKNTQDASDAAATIAFSKASAKTIYNALDEIGRTVRAIAKLTVDEINNLRQRDRDRSTDVAAAISLADLKTRWAARSALDDRTYVQAKTAVENIIDGE